MAGKRSDLCRAGLHPMNEGHPNVKVRQGRDRIYRYCRACLKKTERKRRPRGLPQLLAEHYGSTWRKFQLEAKKRGLNPKVLLGELMDRFTA
jgi:hypothetical protein